MNIAGLAIKRPVFIVMIVLSIITVGILGYSRLPVDLLPNVDFPVVLVSTVYAGASADEVENLVSKPLENALAGVEGLDTLSSVSREGVSIVIVMFSMGVDIKFAELKVREKVQSSRALLPDDIEEPVIRRFSTEDMPIIYMSIQGNKDLSELREILEDTVQPKIETLEGVGSISIIGARKKVVNITLNKGLLAANGINYSQISSAISRRNISYPIGEIGEKEKNINIRVLGKAENLNEIGEIPLTSSTGKVLRIKDIAKVEVKLEDEVEKARVDGKNSVLFAIYKQSGGNTVKVADELHKELENVGKLLPQGVSLKIVSDSSVSIKRSIKGVESDILIGALLAVLIVWLFLGNFRSTLITAIALPNSLLGAFFLVYIAGFSLNTMTLLSLSLCVGLLIDDSIVVRENIFRYIEHGLSPKEAAVKGTNEVALAVLSTTLSILAVFIPISFLSGVIGQFFREFGLTVAFALLISLLDAFTTAPMLSAYWYKKTETKNLSGWKKWANDLTVKWNEFYDWFNDLYQDILKWGLNHKKRVLFATLGLFIFSISVFAFGLIGVNFISPTDSGIFTINMETYPGAPLNKIDSYALDVEKYLSTKKDINLYYSQIGGSGKTHSATISVELNELKKRKVSTQDMVADVRQYIKKKYDNELNFLISETSYMNVGGGGGGGNSPITLNISGPDLKVLETLSQKVKKIVSETPGASDSASTMKPGSPELVIRLDNIKAEKMGMTSLELGLTLRDLLQGATVSTYNKNGRDYDIVIRLDERQRKTVDDIRNMIITTKTGKKIPLTAICTFSYSSAPLEIRRENKQRVVKITANIEKGFSLGEVNKKIKARIDQEIKFPSGYNYSFAGQQKQMADMFGQMLVAIFLAIVFMYMILASLYNSFIQPLILMLSIVLAIIGSFLALLITGVSLDIYGWIGLLLVLGLVAKNAILLIDFTNKSRGEGMSIRDALLHAGPVRLRPILMTSFAMIFGMLPLALGLNEGSSGRQALPMVVIGGILTSTFLTLIVVPIVYEWVESRMEARKRKKLHA